MTCTLAVGHAGKHACCHACVWALGQRVVLEPGTWVCGDCGGEIGRVVCGVAIDQPKTDERER